MSPAFPTCLRPAGTVDSVVPSRESRPGGGRSRPGGRRRRATAHPRAGGRLLASAPVSIPAASLPGVPVDGRRRTPSAAHPRPRPRPPRDRRAERAVVPAWPHPGRGRAISGAARIRATSGPSVQSPGGRARRVLVGSESLRADRAAAAVVCTSLPWWWCARGTRTWRRRCSTRQRRRRPHAVRRRGRGRRLVQRREAVELLGVLAIRGGLNHLMASSEDGGEAQSFKSNLLKMLQLMNEKYNQSLNEIQSTTVKSSRH
ncbi:HHIP-like protein 1 [Panicum hallii]|uniref:HHIP-like protein 1 n=1 Tax=Panicum hallii TaxID=206008 RepID=UPI000DF4CDE1|nr:HHIP-like protein 1 [Panicum hallii]